jgi:hypothetical protein
MLVQLKSGIRRVLPEGYRPIGYLTNLVRNRTGGVVRQGPFKGMRYVANSVGSAYLPKLLGIYERELAPRIEQICAAKPALIVDVGAAEGYYAVGLALRNPQARMIAFETEENGRVALKQMARLNGVPRLEIRGKCEPNDLQTALAGNAAVVVVCDVEGYEDKLLDLTSVSALRQASILVETHEFVVPGITENLKCRFDRTHTVEQIWDEPRSRDEFPWRTLATALLPERYLDWAVSEWRPVRMAWLWMQPKVNL